MQQANKNLYKQIGILLDVELAVHITRQHNTLLPLWVSISAMLAMKLFTMNRPLFLLASVEKPYPTYLLDISVTVYWGSLCAYGEHLLARLIRTE